MKSTRTYELTGEQKQAADDMVRRRMANTHETEGQARRYVANWFKERAAEARTIAQGDHIKVALPMSNGGSKPSGRIASASTTASTT